MKLFELVLWAVTGVMITMSQYQAVIFFSSIIVALLVSYKIGYRHGEQETLKQISVLLGEAIDRVKTEPQVTSEFEKVEVMCRSAPNSSRIKETSRRCIWDKKIGDLVGRHHGEVAVLRK